MFTYEYRFYPDTFTGQEFDDFVDNVQWFMSSLYKNGQILSSYQITVKYPEYFICRCVALEMDSLSEKYHNKYTKQDMAVLCDSSQKPPELFFIGESYDEEECCICDNSSHYILYTNCQTSAPPVLCGDCKRPVPLYKFPKTYDDSDYFNLLGWQKAYQACDRQFLEGIGERHGYKMMHDPESVLSREGIRFCRLLEAKTEKPFYYYLFNYYSKNKTVCPKCKESWTGLGMDEIYKIHYSYVCHSCKLVSD